MNLNTAQESPGLTPEQNAEYRRWLDEWCRACHSFEPTDHQMASARAIVMYNAATYSPRNNHPPHEDKRQPAGES